MVWMVGRRSDEDTVMPAPEDVELHSISRAMPSMLAQLLSPARVSADTMVRPMRSLQGRPTHAHKQPCPARPACGAACMWGHRGDADVRACDAL